MPFIGPPGWRAGTRAAMMRPSRMPAKPTRSSAFSGSAEYSITVNPLTSGSTPETLQLTAAGDLLWWVLAAVLAYPVLVIFQSLVVHQTLMGNFPMIVRWQAHRYLLRQSISFFHDEFAGRIATRVMQTALAVRATQHHGVENARSLEAALQFYCGREHGGAHDAMSDVNATIDVLAGQLARYDDLPRSAEDLAAWCDPTPPGAVRHRELTIRRWYQ